jgi:hypothetical protein
MAKTLWPNPHLIQFRLSLRGSRRSSDASETRNGFPPSTLKGLNRPAASSPRPKVQIGNEKSFPLSDPERVESIRRFFPSFQVVLGNELIYSYLLSHARPHNGKKDSRRENKHGMSKESLDNRKAFGEKGHIYEIEPSCFLLQVLDPEGVRQDTTGKNKKSSPSARHRS